MTISIRNPPYMKVPLNLTHLKFIDFTMSVRLRKSLLHPNNMKKVKTIFLGEFKVCTIIGVENIGPFFYNIFGAFYIKPYLL